MNLKEEILKLKEEKNALIVAHLYQCDEIQEIADIVGDSYFLSKKAMESNEEMAMKHLSLAGMYGQNASRSWFTNPKNNWPPNSPAVIAAKKRKGSTEPKPLIDTGDLRKSITYFVDRKGTRTK